MAKLEKTKRFLTLLWNEYSWEKKQNNFEIEKKQAKNKDKTFFLSTIPTNIAVQRLSIGDTK